MIYQPLTIADVILITPRVFSDERGFFMETFRQQDFVKHCGNVEFVQDNHSSSTKGVLRGLHYQHQHPQGKLVRVTRGEIFDVVVDMRKHSATFGKWLGVTLSETNQQQLWVPPGFAHGFYVTSDIAECQYKCTNYYVPGDEHILSWNDPTLGIQWPATAAAVILSPKDRQGLAFSACPYF